MGFKKGMIIKWHGSIASIPDGWAFCDGSNGTPDLRSRMVLGAEDEASIGNIGGSVNHNHPFTADPHNHLLLGPPGLASGTAPFYQETSTFFVTGTTDSTEGRPPFYVLAYIMRLLDDAPPFLEPWPYAAKAIIQFIMESGNLLIFLTFRFKMNTTKKPADVLWICTLDGTPDAVDSSLWLDQFTLLLVIVSPAAPPARVTVEYDGPDTNLETVWGKQWEPWGPIPGVSF